MLQNLITLDNELYSGRNIIILKSHFVPCHQMHKNNIYFEGGHFRKI